MITAIVSFFGGTLLKWGIAAVGLVGVVIASWVHGKSAGTTAAQNAAQATVDSAAAKVTAADTRASAAEADAAAAQATTDAVKSRQEIDATVSKQTDVQVKNELDNDWSR